MNVLDTNQNKIHLPRLISDGMVLQRREKTLLRGQALPLSNLELRFIRSDKSIEFSSKTQVSKDGTWELSLAPEKAGGPYTIEIQTEYGDQVAHSLVKNIMVGDVWLCSGQSNMTVLMSRVQDLYKEEIASCNEPDIRLFTVPQYYDFNTPQDDFESGSWIEATPKNIFNFAAVPYFFAKQIYEKYGIPIGLINASIGGTPIESWMSCEALSSFPKSLDEVEEVKDRAYIEKVLKDDEKRVSLWHEALHEKDPGLKNPAWYELEYKAENWDRLQLPSLWKDIGQEHFSGSLWLRKEIDIPSSMTGIPALLYLGTIIDSDTVYINGKKVGNTTYLYPPRRYEIAPDVLVPGKNLISIRVVTNAGQGGFTPDKPYRLDAGSESLILEGEWEYKIAASAEPLAAQIFFQYKPLGLYNGMISPLLHHAIKGILWYQGETNTWAPEDYHEKLSTLIKDWRKKWSLGELPFIYVQLPNYLEADSTPSESNWAELREQQLHTLSVSNTAMAIAIELGEWNDLHPFNKKDIGIRLALGARFLAYGEKDLVYSGPIFEKMEKQENKLILTFKNPGRSLVTKDGELKHFAIAGEDKKFIWANAKIVHNPLGDRVEVWNPTISEPKYVRYAWANNPKGANLYNEANLPASPFQAKL